MDARRRGLVLVLVLCAADALGEAAAAAARDFPPGFRFGAASAAYQVEGAWNHSDKGESIWDRLVHSRPELVRDGATGDVACDSHRLWQTDVQLAKDLGLHFYRFSLSWPRLLPEGFAHNVSDAGARYYSQLIDGLLAAGIEPMVTLYHWDLPQRLQDLGGWQNPHIVEWFGDYARVAFRLFGSRVPTWVTINEPLVMCDLALTGGALAPGVRDDRLAPHLCARHVLLAHAQAYHIYDQHFRQDFHGKVSIGNHAMWYEPETDSEEDKVATDLTMQFVLGRYANPIFGDGDWPKSVKELVDGNSAAQGYPRSRLPPFSAAEQQLLRGSFDYFALNHYTTRTVQAGTHSTPGDKGWAGFPFYEWDELPVSFSSRPEWPTACNHWLKVYPQGLRKLLAWIKAQYGDVEVVITENGYPTCERSLDDPERISYLQAYLEQLLLAAADGVRVTGYTAWTLLDNFEWNDGYRFGLHEVDFSSEERTRTPRRSAHYYAAVIAHHSLDVPASAAPTPAPSHGEL